MSETDTAALYREIATHGRRYLLFALFGNGRDLMFPETIIAEEGYEDADLETQAAAYADAIDTWFEMEENHEDEMLAHAEKTKGDRADEILAEAGA